MVTTILDALEQARARWGSRAVVQEQTTRDARGNFCIARLVGFQDDPWSWRALGRGLTWEQAFEDADRAEGRVNR